MCQSKMVFTMNYSLGGTTASSGIIHSTQTINLQGQKWPLVGQFKMICTMNLKLNGEHNFQKPQYWTDSQ